jgi:hypothetical protein
MGITIVETNAGYREPANEHDRYLIQWIEDKFQMLRPFQACPSGQGELRHLKWLLDVGRFFPPQRLPKPYRVGEAQACYMNSQTLALMGDGELTYVEGIGLRIGVFLHSWCIDAQGNVVDTTWHGRSKKQMAGTAYFGVPISNGDIMRAILATKHHDQIITPETLAPLVN